ncbi:MAG: hypothetical protein K0A90_05055 [Methanosarcinaceae archaeon]|nr:hypothetical protein [Methanosarcinaceae archaeon]
MGGQTKNSAFDFFIIMKSNERPVKMLTNTFLFINLALSQNNIGMI